MKKFPAGAILLFLFTLAFVFGLSQFSEYESAQSLVSALLSGSLTQGHSINVLYFASHFLLADFYGWLYNNIPGIPWYEGFMFGYIALSLFAILSLLWYAGKNLPLCMRALFIAVTLLVSTEFLLYMESTRTAFMLGTASTLLLFSSLQGKRDVRISLLLFIICLLTRPEVGIFILLFQWLALAFYSSKKTAIRFLLLHTLATTLVMGYITYDRLTTTDYIKQFEPELGYQLLDRGNIVPLSSMANQVDSARYVAVQNMIMDSAYVSIDFLRSLVGNDPYTGISSELVGRCLNIFAESVDKAFGLIVIYAAVLMLLAWHTFKQNRKRALLWLAYQLVFWLVIIITIYTIKMEVWVFSSAIIMMILIMLIQIPSVMQKNIPGILITVALIGYGTFKLFKHQYEYSQMLVTERYTSAMFTDKLKQKAAGKIILPGIDQALYLTHSVRPYKLPDYKAFKRIYLLDSDMLHLEKNYKEYLKQECNCNAGDYMAVWDFVANQKNNSYIVMDSLRLSQIVNYSSVVRGRNYQLTAIDSIKTDNFNSVIYKFE